MFEFEIFNIHRLEDREKYYPIIAKWWEDWNWPVIDHPFLSTTGVMVKHNDEYICAGWLFQTDSLTCVSDYFISAKKRFAGSLKKDALKSLLTKIEELGKKFGFLSVYTSVRSPHLIKIMLELGYGEGTSTGKGDEDMTVFIKRI